MQEPYLPGCFLVILIIIAIPSLAIASYMKVLPSGGYIKALGIDVFTDPQCTNLVTLIDWGPLSSSYVKDSQVYFLKNTRDETIVNVNMTYANFTPSGFKQYIGLIWNYSGTWLNPSDVLPVYFTISTYNAPMGTDFFFDITLNAQY